MEYDYAWRAYGRPIIDETGDIKIVWYPKSEGIYVRRCMGAFVWFTETLTARVGTGLPLNLTLVHTLRTRVPCGPE